MVSRQNLDLEPDPNKINAKFERILKRLLDVLNSFRTEHYEEL